MSFLKLIIKNPFRRKNSTILAILGICIGIIMIVSLGIITDTLVSSFDDTLKSGGADFMIASTDTGETAFGTNTLSSNWTEKIANFEGVKEAVPFYSILVQHKSGVYIPLIGINQNQSSLAELTVNEGRLYKDDTNEIIVGKLYSKNNNVSLGDSLTFKGSDYKVVGIFETGKPNEDGGVYTSIKTVEKLSNEKGKISNIFVGVEKGQDPKKVADNIEKKYGDNISTILSLMDLKSMATSINMLKTASWGISLLAIVIGGLGIINTMLMSVYERTREIGVLKAVGWSRSRILQMIMGESLVITLIAAIIGSIIGVALSHFIGPSMGFNSISLNINIFIQAFAVAIIVGMVGGLYPAIKAVNLPPTEALRYE